MSVPSLLTSGKDETDKAQFVTGTFTTVKDGLVMLFLVTGQTGGGSEPILSVTHPFMGQMDEVITIPTLHNGLRLSIWSGIATGGTGAFTISLGVPQGIAMWQVVQITSNVATPTIKQTASFATVGTGNQGATLATAPAASSCVVGIMGLNQGSLAVTNGTGFTAIGTRVSSTQAPVSQVWSQYDNASATALSAFGFGSNASNKSFVTLEIVDGVLQDKTYYWNGTTEVECDVFLWDGVVEKPVTLSLT